MVIFNLSGFIFLNAKAICISAHINFKSTYVMVEMLLLHSSAHAASVLPCTAKFPFGSSLFIDKCHGEINTLQF